MSALAFRFPFILIALFLFAIKSLSAATYYVSSSLGDDNNDGLSMATPFATVAQSNQLALNPGDQVLFRCDDIWQGEMLVITESGSLGAPLLYGSYPQGCQNKPILSGSLPIQGWVLHAGNIFVANLASGANLDNFPNGINQLFRNNQRLRLGRWPNLDANSDGGYSTVDAHTPNSQSITDNELPLVDWTGAVIHIKGIRWYIMNRVVTGSAGTTLDLAANIRCYQANGPGATCSGWGYFINSHLDTLDQDGEWYFNEATNQVYVYSEGGVPSDTEMEGSAILSGAGNDLGGIILGRHLVEHIQHVTIENFMVRNWFAHGITTPTNLELDDNSNLILRNNTIRNVDAAGLNLATWIWNAGANSGWRGGKNQLIENNIIDGANHYGINTYSIDTQYSNNQIVNIGLVENFGRSGMGCGFDTDEFCTDFGSGIRVSVLNNQALFSGHNNTFLENRLERIGMSGITLAGFGDILQNNFIREACFAKGDCGGIRTFGQPPLLSSPVRDTNIIGNVVLDTLGNTDGTSPTFRARFGFGIYIDNFSRDINVLGNTVTNSTAAGVLYQHSTGVIQDNTLYNNAIGDTTNGQITLMLSDTRVSSTNNILYGLINNFPTLSNGLIMRIFETTNLTAANNNFYFQPYLNNNIWVEQLGTHFSFSDWQVQSGLDGTSTSNWFFSNPGISPQSELFYNDTNLPVNFALGAAQYQDLDQNLVAGSIQIGPYKSMILIRNGDQLFSNGFESGTTSAWSFVAP